MGILIEVSPCGACGRLHRKVEQHIIWEKNKISRRYHAVLHVCGKCVGSFPESAEVKPRHYEDPRPGGTDG